MGDGPADLARSTAEGVGGFSDSRFAFCCLSLRPVVIGSVLVHLGIVYTSLSVSLPCCFCLLLLIYKSINLQR